MYKLKKINKTMMYQIATDMGVDMGAKRADCEFEREYRHNGAWLKSSSYKLHLDTCMGVVYLYVRSCDGCEDFVLKPELDYLESHGYLVEIPDDDEEPETAADPEPETNQEAEPEAQDEDSNPSLDLELYDVYADVSVLGGLVDIPFPPAGWVLDKNHYTLLGYLLNERGPDASPAAYLKVYDKLQSYIHDYAGSLIEFFYDSRLPEFHERLDEMADSWKPISERHMMFEIKLLRLWEWLHDDVMQRYPFEPDGRAIIIDDAADHDSVETDTYNELFDALEWSYPLKKDQPIPPGAKLIGVIDHWPEDYPYRKTIMEIWQDKAGNYLSREQET